MQRHQDAFAVPFQHPGVHLDVARPSGDRGETHVVACLGGQETAASSSLLSNEVTTNGGLQKQSLAMAKIWWAKRGVERDWSGKTTGRF